MNLLVYGPFIRTLKLSRASQIKQFLVKPLILAIQVGERYPRPRPEGSQEGKSVPLLYSSNTQSTF
jgi:hypothetical protein